MTCLGIAAADQGGSRGDGILIALLETTALDQQTPLYR